MNIEIKDFYGWKRNLNGFIGTLRIRLTDFGFDILGIKVVFAKDEFYFTLPFCKSYCPKKNKIAHFPLVTFVDRDQNRELLAYLYENGPKFIMERLKDKERPVLWPEEEKLARAKDFEAKKRAKKIYKKTLPKRANPPASNR